MRLVKSIVILIVLSMSMLAAAAEPRLVTWNVDGVKRQALVFAPSAGSAQDRHPLIFGFHGHGGNMRSASKFGLQNQWPNAIVVYPDGLLTSSSRDPQGRRPGWQRLAGDDGDRDLKFFDSMLTSLRRDYRVDDGSIFATGFSNGAFFSLLLWTQRADVFAGFAIVAGALDPSQHLTVAKPVLHVAGQRDPLVTPAKVEPTIAEERRVDAATGQGQNCGTGCVLYHGAKADVKTFWHPGGHVYPPQAAAMTVAFFKAQAPARIGAAPPGPRQSAGTNSSPAASQNEIPATTRSGNGEVTHYPSHGLELKAFVYKPQGAGPFPVYLWNHGSEKAPAPGAKLAQFWVAHGFVLYAPIRSGHGDNPGAYIGDEQKLVQDSKSPAGFRQIVALHERANDDVIAAYQWIAQQPYVDAKRIVIAGGSYGGIQTLLAAERDGRDRLGVKCFVAMSPAAESWGNPNWASRLSRSVDTARAPIFLLQAQNDYNLGPSSVLGPRIDAMGFPSRHRIFPPHGDPNDHAQGHGGFFSDSSAWSEDLLRYVHDCGAMP